MKTFALQRLVNVKFLPFTKELHDILIWQDYSHLNSWGYISDDPILNYFGKGIKGYAMYPNRWLTLENGRWVSVQADEIKIKKTVELPKDLNDETRKKIIEQNPFVGSVDEILNVFAVNDGLTTRVVGYDEKAPEDVSITESHLEFPMKSERLKEMYAPGERNKFYIVFDVKNSYCHRLLYDRIRHKMMPKSSYKNLKIYRSDTLMNSDTDNTDL